MPNEQPSSADESIIAKCCRELAVSEPHAIEICEWSEETFGVPISYVPPVQHIVTIEQMMRLLLKFKNPFMPLKVFGWALNSRSIDDVMGHPNLNDIARQCGCTKANVNKTLKTIQAELNLPIRNGQRTAESRKLMSERRKSQLK